MESKNTDLSMSVTLGPLVLKNPVTVASGTFGYGLEFTDHFDIGCLGGIAVKGLNLKPRDGHSQPRLAEAPAGLLNCIGLQNVGVKVFLEEKLPRLREYDTSIIVNINGSSIEEYAVLAETLSDADGISALEVNVSCPNVTEGGITFGIDPVMTEKVTEEVRKRTHLPVIVKLSPNVTRISTLAKAAWNGGAHILSLINTLLGMAIDAHSRKPKLANLTGGLSGPAIKPVALRCVWETSRAVPLPIIGMGGISTGEDAIEFLLAGATAISVGTANFIDPCAAQRILREMKQYCIDHSINDIASLVGALDLS